MRTLLLSLALLSAGPLPLTAQTPWYGSSGDRWDSWGDSRYPQARLWVEDERDFFRRGQRLDVRFSVAEDAYVALVHIDTDGTLDFVYPSSPWDDGYVRGGRVHTLPRSGIGSLVRGRAGIGYFYLVASPMPLDYGYFASGRGGPWDWSYAGRNVTGDPFWAMEQLTRALLPDPYAPYATDYYSYHVDGRHRYPSYACADRSMGVRPGWGWSSSYGACDRQDFFLREHPYYYDARLYRGDRRAYFRDRYDNDSWDPRHGYKESVDRRPAGGWNGSSQPTPQPRAVTPRRRDPEPPATEPARGVAPRREPQREAAPERRPSLERRERSGSSGSAAPARPAPRSGGASASPARGRAPSTGRVAPRARPAPTDTLSTHR